MEKVDISKVGPGHGGDSSVPKDGSMKQGEGSFDCYHNRADGAGECKDPLCWMQPGGSHLPCDCHPEQHMETCPGAGRDWFDEPYADLAGGIPKAIILPTANGRFMVAKFDLFGSVLRGLTPGERGKDDHSVEAFVPVSTHETYAAAVGAARTFLTGYSLDTDERKAFDAARSERDLKEAS